MDETEDPFDYLPFTIPGVVAGIVISSLCGYFLYNQLPQKQPPLDVTYTSVDGTIEWAGWRRSAMGEGPAWFLQVRLKQDSRGYILSEGEIPEEFFMRFGRPGGSDDEIRELSGKQTTVFFDSTLRQTATPYMAALQVGDDVIVQPRAGRHSSREVGIFVLLLYGLGALIGLGLFTASVQHVVLCLRYKTDGPKRA